MRNRSTTTNPRSSLNFLPGLQSPSKLKSTSQKQPQQPRKRSSSVLCLFGWVVSSFVFVSYLSNNSRIRNYTGNKNDPENENLSRISKLFDRKEDTDNNVNNGPIEKAQTVFRAQTANAKHQERLLIEPIVPLPIFDFSFPYTNGLTTVVGNFLACQMNSTNENHEVGNSNDDDPREGFSMAQSYCKPVHDGMPINEKIKALCGMLIYQESKTSDSFFKGLLKHDFYSHIGLYSNICILPEYNYLRTFGNYLNGGQATIVVNTQSSEDWYKFMKENIKHQFGPEVYGFVPILRRMERCMHKLGHDGDNRGNSTAERLMSWYDQWLEQIRNFASRRDKQISMLEVDVTSSDVGRHLFEAFFGKDKLHEADRSCWERSVLEPEVTLKPKFNNLTNIGSDKVALDWLKFTRISEGTTAEIEFRKTSIDRLKVPSPIFVVGLPKAGTTSIDNFFRCMGVRVSHNLCHDNAFKLSTVERCGRLMKWNQMDGYPIMEYAGDYEVYSQFEDIDACYLPQFTELDAIHDQYPNATFVMNIRNFDDWVSSLRRWRHPSSGYVPLNVRLVRCIDTLPKDFQEKLNSMPLDDQLSAIYSEHIGRVRKFVERHPSHHLYEVKIDDADTGQILENRLLHKDKSKDADVCWGNKNKSKLNKNGSEGSTRQTTWDDSIIPGYIRGVDPSNFPRRHMNVIHNHERETDRLAVPSPILVMDFLEPAKSISYFFSCLGSRSSFNVCSSDLFDLSYPRSCSFILQTNFNHNFPMFFFSGNYHVYTHLHDLADCFIPQLMHLNAIHEGSPNATFIVNPYNVSARFASLDEGTRKSLVMCLKPVAIDKNLKWDADESSVVETIYSVHISILRQFVKDHPSHELVEIDWSNKDKNLVEDLLRRKFYNQTNWQKGRKRVTCLL